jgi:hypothetical protein
LTSGHRITETPAARSNLPQYFHDKQPGSRLSLDAADGADSDFWTWGNKAMFAAVS